MISRAMSLIAALSLAFALCLAPAEVHAQQTQVEETRWSGRAVWDNGENKVWTVYFRRDGVLVYGYEGRQFDNGRWRQNGRLITWDTNDYFAIYVGEVDESGMDGAMFNRNGSRGTWSFSRQ